MSIINPPFLALTLPAAVCDSHTRSRKIELAKFYREKSQMAFLLAAVLQTNFAFNESDSNSFRTARIDSRFNADARLLIEYASSLDGIGPASTRRHLAFEQTVA